MGDANTMDLSAEDILKTWVPFKAALSVGAVLTESDYARARSVLQFLLDEVRDDEQHPLAEVVDFLGDRMRAFENQRVPIPPSEPREVLRFLMDQHALRQEDLADCAPQGRISDVLSGRRAISKALAKKLAARFAVGVELFI